MAGGGMMGFDFNQPIQDNKDVNTTFNGTTSKKRNLTKEGFDKIVQDILGADNGLASIVSGENASGGYGGTTKALLAQDLVVKLAGELANITSEEVTTTRSLNEADSQTPLNEFFGEPESLGDITDGTVICTALHQVGRFIDYYYKHPKAIAYYNLLSGRTLAGYQIWANKIAAHILKYPSGWVADAMLYTCRNRYRAIIYRTSHWTIWLGEPVCYVIGYFLEKFNHGRSANA